MELKAKKFVIIIDNCNFFDNQRTLSFRISDAKLYEDRESAENEEDIKYIKSVLTNKVEIKVEELEITYKFKKEEL